MSAPRQVHVIDSHTGGEPTRVVVAGGPALQGVTPAERLRDFAENHDRFRSAVVNEPRGSDILVGALLMEPLDRACAAGVVFFNNVGVLGMCGHGTIGLAETLHYLGRIGAGDLRIETPVGPVTATLHEDGSVSVRNVPSYRLHKDVVVQVNGSGPIRGDVAWGGNWFFLASDHGQDLLDPDVHALTLFAERVRGALLHERITGAGGAEIDHIELFGPPSVPHADSRNFVLCPGGAYDRSPCGTGTSAKLSCLYEDGRLGAGQVWRQEGITGSVFEGSVSVEDGAVIPTIRGRAFVTAEATLLLDPSDPLTTWLPSRSGGGTGGEG